jgi:SAM-dependent methyltransferase
LGKGTRAGGPAVLSLCTRGASSIRLGVNDAPGLYQDVEIYDILHAPGTAAEVTGLRRMARRFAGAAAQSGVWLEPACGTGRYLCAATARGARCFGFDSSPEMVAFARQRLEETMAGRPEAPRGRIFQADMAGFRAGLGRTRVDFAFNLINTIRHLEDDAAMLAHFEEMAAVLKPAGAYAVGLSTSAYGMESPSEDVWEGSRRGTRVKQVVEFVPPTRGRFEQVYSHLVITRGGEEEHRDSTYRLRCYSTEQWMRLLGRSAMELAGIVDEDGEVMKAPAFGYAIWILRPRTPDGSAVKKAA